jgi:hypothetical protein
LVIGDGALEGFVEVFWVISNIGFWKPTFVNNKERGKLAYQSPQGLVDRIGEALSIIWLA